MMKLVKGRESRLPADSVQPRDEAGPGSSLISVRKCSQEASASSHTTPIISRPSRHPCVSIYRVLFKLWEGSSVWACWHLSPCVCRCWQSLIVSWRSASCHVRMVGREEPAYMRTIWLCWHPAEGGTGEREECFCWCYSVACNCL